MRRDVQTRNTVIKTYSFKKDIDQELSEFCKRTGLKKSTAIEQGLKKVFKEFGVSK